MLSQGAQVGKGQTVRTPFVGESLTVRHRHHKAGRSAVHVQAAIATQRLKVPKAIKQGTQKIAAAAKKAAPKKSGTQPVLKPLVPRVSGTQIKKAAKLTSIALFGEKGKGFRPRQSGPTRAAPALLARVEQLRLLSKAEQAGLLSLAERSGLTLSFIERSGLLSKAESLGLLSLATDRNTPGTLKALTAALFAAGPALVYFVPDNSTPLVVAQVLGALLCVVGGSAAWGGATLIGALQKD